MTETEPGQTTPAATAGRLIPLCGVLIVALALVGFLRGIAESAASAITTGSHETVTTPKNGRIAEAVTYREMPVAPFRANSNWKNSLDQLQFEQPLLFDPVQRTPEMKLAALEDRSRTRAFEGAPPVIPHPVDQQSAASCLACHGQGIRLGDRVATKISHAHFTSCTQCHVESDSSVPALDSEYAGNDFPGLARTGPGDRAYAGAPPTIPHSLWLRNDCLSCHGLVARPGLRTTHPWLSNCVQCHAAAAELNHGPAL